MRIRTLTLGILLLAIEFRATAQDHTIIDVSGGMALNYMVPKSNREANKPLYLPHASIYVIIPIQGWFFLRTGLGYQQKGFESHMSGTDTAAVTSDMTNRQKLHYISTPLQLCYRAPITSRSEYFISAGMDYGFLVRADATLDVNTYDNGSFLHNQSITYHPKVVMSPVTSPFKTKEGAQYLFFNPSARIDASFFWEKQYSISAFWEYDLTNISANPNNSITKMGCFGFSIGALIQ